MKTFTTLTAVAALIAGMSFANAQSSTTNPPPSSINAGTQTGTGTSQSGSESKGTAMKSGGQQVLGKMNVTGKSKFCITVAPGSNGLNCKFATLAACQTEAKPGNKQCQENPNMAGTTGMK